MGPPFFNFCWIQSWYQTWNLVYCKNVSKNGKIIFTLVLHKSIFQAFFMYLHEPMFHFSLPSLSSSAPFIFLDIPHLGIIILWKTIPMKCSNWKEHSLFLNFFFILAAQCLHFLVQMFCFSSSVFIFLKNSKDLHVSCCFHGVLNLVDLERHGCFWLMLVYALRFMFHV